MDTLPPDDPEGTKGLYAGYGQHAVPTEPTGPPQSSMFAGCVGPADRKRRCGKCGSPPGEPCALFPCTEPTGAREDEPPNAPLVAMARMACAAINTLADELGRDTGDGIKLASVPFIRDHVAALQGALATARQENASEYLRGRDAQMKAVAVADSSWKTRAEEYAAENTTLRARIAELEREGKEKDALLNAPELHDFSSAVVLEAAHQRSRWGVEHDVGKQPSDWFWLVGYLAGKALASHIAGNTDKALHHCISTSAALANWHAAISGANNAMQPGHAPSVALATPPADGGA